MNKKCRFSKCLILVILPVSQVCRLLDLANHFGEGFDDRIHANGRAHIAHLISEGESNHTRLSTY